MKGYDDVENQCLRYHKLRFWLMEQIDLKQSNLDRFRTQYDGELVRRLECQVDTLKIVLNELETITNDSFQRVFNFKR